MTIEQVLKQVEKLQKGFDDAVVKSLQEAEDFIKTKLIQGQLYAGVDGDLDDLTPTYTDDPYFVQMTDDPKRSPKENKAAAERYAKWWQDEFKMELTPPRPNTDLDLPARDPDTPNLIIIGTFYDSIYVDVDKKSIRIGTTGVDFGEEIERKYGSEIFKLSIPAIKWLIFDYVHPGIVKYARQLGFR